MPINTQQVTSQMVNVAVVSIFAESLGILMAGGELTKPPVGQAVPPNAYQELAKAFGYPIVNKSYDIAMKRVKTAGGDPDKDIDIVMFSRIVEEVFKKDLERRYGTENASSALTACPPGDVRCVREVAKSLKESRIGSKSSPYEVANAILKGQERAST